MFDTIIEWLTILAYAIERARWKLFTVTALIFLAAILAITFVKNHPILQPLSDMYLLLISFFVLFAIFSSWVRIIGKAIKDLKRSGFF